MPIVTKYYLMVGDKKVAFETGREVHIASHYVKQVGDDTNALKNIVAFTLDVLGQYDRHMREYMKHLNRTLTPNIYRVCRYIKEGLQDNPEFLNTPPRDVLLNFLNTAYGRTEGER